MKKSIGFLFAVIVSSAACNSADKKTAVVEKDRQVYQKTKETLAEQERKSPEQFISVSSHDKHNLIGQEVVKIKVTNNASVAVYKDIDLELKYYSKTGALLISEKETVYEKLGPGEHTTYKAKNYQPKGTDSAAVKVLGAKAVE